MEEIFLILVGIAWAVGTPIVAIVALVRTGRLRDQNERLTADLARLKRQLAERASPLVKVSRSRSHAPHQRHVRARTVGVVEAASRGAG